MGAKKEEPTSPNRLPFTLFRSYSEKFCLETLTKPGILKYPAKYKI
jgi:hypothetical protein